MKPAGPAIAARNEIVSFYRKATYCYAAPFILLLLGLITPFPGGLWLFTLLPFGVAGLLFTRRGLALAVKSGDRDKKDVGYANVLMGIVVLLLGLLILAFAYVRM